jgi:hypothetical protein
MAMSHVTLWHGECLFETLGIAPKMHICSNDKCHLRDTYLISVARNYCMLSRRARCDPALQTNELVRFYFCRRFETALMTFVLLVIFCFKTSHV